MKAIETWQKMAPLLVDVATGRKPADTVVRNAISCH